jgi:phosphoenolpyruvate synthase/pyruvate phosphate dikinase
MMRVLPIEKVRTVHRPHVGGKAHALARLARHGFKTPLTLCVTTRAYQEFTAANGLRERILLELHRKAFDQMRWEEIWDCAARIRNLFLTRTMPRGLKNHLTRAIETAFGDRSVAVRSSAPDEDSRRFSFAGLHDSYINVRGADSVLDHIRKVWASLWSDAALLYRQEIGLKPEKSSMAVVLQETVGGDRSGVIFTRSPGVTSQGVVEAVYGLNQGLVDGAVEPDRWTLDREARSMLSHRPAKRLHRMDLRPAGGLELKALPPEAARRPPLTDAGVLRLFDTAMAIEALFGAPQDVEWSTMADTAVILQARPITTTNRPPEGDDRNWYLSLHRSFENLKSLRAQIENDRIPAMIRTAAEMAAVDLGGLSHRELAGEIRRRWDANEHWVNVYWSEFIPYAHGVRLFGQVYNDTLRPENPYEFVDLLVHTDMISLQRNRSLEQLAAAVRRDPSVAQALRAGRTADLPEGFSGRLREFIRAYGDLTCGVSGATGCEEQLATLANLLLEMASHPTDTATDRSRSPAADLEARFVAAFDAARKTDARDLLELARSSYRLRDDDNIHLGRIEAQLIAAVQEGRRRLAAVPAAAEKSPDLRSLSEALAGVDPAPVDSPPARPSAAVDPRYRARQLIGQPAGPGIAKGPARVVYKTSDLSGFQFGDVLVCDAVDPNMTFVVPLAAAIVERRGGMLIHGAIIAREYGLPCVTGVAEAISRIAAGDALTVDGYLGIVTIGD